MFSIRYYNSVLFIHVANLCVCVCVWQKLTLRYRNGRLIDLVALCRWISSLPSFVPNISDDDVVDFFKSAVFGFIRWNKTFSISLTWYCEHFKTDSSNICVSYMECIYLLQILKYFGLRIYCISRSIWLIRGCGSKAHTPNRIQLIVVENPLCSARLD